MRVKKICFVASSGGHLEELYCLRELANTFHACLITEESQFSTATFGENVYFVPQINRKEKKFFVHFIKLFFEAGRILKIEKPDCIISTGALMTVPICVLAKVKRKKIIYIESFARVNHASLTGRIMYHIADLFLVQWPDMKKCFPKSEYFGGIF